MHNFDHFVTPRLVDTIIPALPYHTGLTVQMARLEKNVQLYREFLISSAKRGLFHDLANELVGLIEKVRSETGYQVRFPRTWAEMSNAHPECADSDRLVYVMGSIGLLIDCIVLLICVDLMFDTEAKQVREPFLDIWQEMEKSNLFESAVFFNRIFRLLNKLDSKHVNLRPVPRDLCLKILKTCIGVCPQATLSGFISAPSASLQTTTFVEDMLTEYVRLITYYLYRTNFDEVNGYILESFSITLPTDPKALAFPRITESEIYVDHEFRIDLVAMAGPTTDAFPRLLEVVHEFFQKAPTAPHRQLIVYFFVKNLFVFSSMSPNLKDEWEPATLRLAEKLYLLVQHQCRNEKEWTVSYDKLCLSALPLVLPFDVEPSDPVYRPWALLAIWEEQVRHLKLENPKARRSAVQYFVNFSGFIWTGCQGIENSYRYETVAQWLVKLYPAIKAELFETREDGSKRVLWDSKQVLSRFYLFYTMFHGEQLLEDQKGVFEDSPAALQSLLSSLLFAHTSGAPSIWDSVKLWEDEVIRLLEVYASDAEIEKHICPKGLVLVYGLTVFIRSSRFVRRVKRENTLRLMAALVKLMGSQIPILLDKIMEFMICTMQFLSQSRVRKESVDFFSKVYDLISGLMAMQTPKLLYAEVLEDLGEGIDHLGKFLQLRLEAGSRLFDLGTKIHRSDAKHALELRAAVLRCLLSSDHRTVMRALDCLRILHKGMSLGIVEAGDDIATINTAADYAMITEIVHSDAYKLQSAAIAHRCLINYFKTLVSPGPTIKLLYDSLISTWEEMLQSLPEKQHLDLDSQRRMMVLHKFIFIMNTMWLDDPSPELQSQSLNRIYRMIQLVLSPNHYVRDLTFSCLSLRLGLPPQHLNRCLDLISRVLRDQLPDDLDTLPMDRKTLISSLTRLVSSAQIMIENIYNDTSNSRVVMDGSITNVTERILHISMPVLMEYPEMIGPAMERVLGTVIAIGRHDDLFMTKKSVLVDSLLPSMVKCIEQLNERHPVEVEECIVLIARALEALTDGYSFDIPPEGPRIEQYTQFIHLVKSVDLFRLRLGALEDQKRDSVRAMFQRSLTNLFSSNIELAYLMLFDDAFLSDMDLRVGLYNAFATSVEEEQDAFVQMASRYAKLGDYLTENHEVLFAMCDTCAPTETESLAELLVSFFDNRGQAFEIMGAIAELEISRQKDCCDIFRQNSPLAKVVITYMATKVSTFLVARIGPLVQRIIKSRYVFLAKNDDCARVLIDCRDLVADLEKHQSEIPLIVRKFSRLIYDLVEARFKGYGLVALNNIFLLRCVCPAIVSPDRYGMMERAPVGGVLTSLLNNANAVQKYCGYMSPDIDLRNRVKQLFMNLIDVSLEVTEETTLSGVNNTDYDHVNLALHTYLYRHGHEIRNACLSSPDFDMDKFTAMHRALGRPTTISLFNTNRRRSRAWSARSGSGPRQLSAASSLQQPGSTPSIKTYLGTPCFIMSADMSVAHKNMVLARFMEFQNQVSKDGSECCVLQDLTLPSITLEHWLALSDVILDAVPQEFMSRLKENVVLNLPYNIAHLSRSRHVLAHPLRAYTFKTYSDMDIDLMEDLEVRDITLQYARDFASAARFERTPVLHHGDILVFDVYVGREAVHLKYTGPDFTSLDVVPFKRVHLDNMNYRIRLQANQGSFATTYVIEQQPHVYRKISAVKSRALNQKRCDPQSCMLNLHADHTGALLLLALVDLCALDQQVWTPAYQLLCALSASLGARTGPDVISGSAQVLREMQIDSVAAVSKRLMKTHPDTSGVVRMFTKMLGSEHVDLEAAARIAAPWLSHLATLSLGQDKDMDTLLVTLFTRMCDSKRDCETLCCSMFPNIERSERATAFLADALVAFIVHRRMRGESSPEWVVPSVASMVHPRVAQNIFEHIAALTNVDVGYEVTNWTSHPNWLEIETELTFLAHVKVDQDLLTDTMPHYLLCSLVFSGIGPYSFRLAQYRCFLNLVDALVRLPNLDDFSARRLRSLWNELHTTRSRTLFAVQDETIDSSYTALADFTFHQAEQLGRLIYELYSTGAIIFCPVHELRAESQSLMLRLMNVTFPPLQRRCIFGLCVVHRFEVPDETYEQLLKLMVRVLKKCSGADVLMVYVRAIFVALSKLVMGVSRASAYKQTLNIFVLAFLWHRLLPAYPEALPMFTNYMLINDYTGEFSSQRDRLDYLASNFKTKLGDWWEDTLKAPVPTGENIAIVVNDTFVFGLQHSETQNVAMAAVEKVSYQMTSRDWRQKDWSPEMWLPFAATMFLVCQDVGKLQTVPVLTSHLTNASMLDKDTLLHEMTKCLASFLNNTNPSTIITLVQCCSLTGQTTSMNFMHAGPRLLSLLSYVESEEVINLICPLLRPTILRLLELDDPEMNSRVLEWTLKLIRPRANADWNARLLKILEDNGFGYLVDKDLNLLPIKPNYSITPEIRASLTGLCERFFNKFWSTSNQSPDASAEAKTH